MLPAVRDFDRPPPPFSEFRLSSPSPLPHRWPQTTQTTQTATQTAKTTAKTTAATAAATTATTIVGVSGEITNGPDEITRHRDDDPPSPPSRRSH